MTSDMYNVTWKPSFEREFEHESYVMFKARSLLSLVVPLFSPPAIVDTIFVCFNKGTQTRETYKPCNKKVKKKSGRKGREKDHKKDDGDGNDGETYAQPIARSPVLTVESQGRAFISSLKFLRKRIENAMGMLETNEGKKKFQIPRSISAH